MFTDTNCLLELINLTVLTPNEYFGLNLLFNGEDYNH